MIKGLHHNAYRCRDSEETRGFYEDFLGLRLVSAFEIDEGRGLHSFFEMDDASCLAFFEVTGKQFDFKRQDTLDLGVRARRRTRRIRSHAGQGPGGGDRGARTGRSRLRPVDLHARSKRLRGRADGQHGRATEIMDPAISKPHEALARWRRPRRQGNLAKQVSLEPVSAGGDARA